jgi:Arc/MetJ-type ribon-helix-helix transcriptional regulator
MMCRFTGKPHDHHTEAAPHVRSFIEEKLRSGRYRTPEEVVQAGLAALMQQPDDFSPGEWDELLAEGEASIERYGTLDGDEALDARRRRRSVR